jgi:pyruvate/2-oxoglutarate dehydrogenase complex dihydrolipoamide acyltransferase (E2) component
MSSAIHRVIIPIDFWEEEVEAVITTWFVSDAAEVDKGDLLAEVMAEKIQFEIVAPVTGTLTIVKQQDQLIDKGDVIATITSAPD